MALITSLGLMATDIYAPALPAVTSALSTSPHLVQLTITTFLISAGLSQLVYGPLSDHWGRRPVLLFGMGIYILGTILCTFAHEMTLLLFGRFIQGIGTGAIMALNRVIIRDTFSGHALAKALSYIGAFIALAPAVAPALGGFIEFHWGWRWIFGFLLFFSLLLSTLAWLTLPESHHSRATGELSFIRVMSNYAIIIKNKQFWANAWCSGLALASMITCATINPFILQTNLHKTAAEYGFWAMVTSVGFMIGMLLNAHIVGRIGPTRTLKIGNLLILSMGLAFIITSYFKILTVSAIILPTIGIELGIAFIFPNAFVNAIAPFPKILGATAALYGCLQVAISFITSMIVAAISEETQMPMGILLACSALLGLIVYRVLSPPTAEKDPSLSVATE